jgi:hypothetical protein
MIKNKNTQFVISFESLVLNIFDYVEVVEMVPKLFGCSSCKDTGY